MEPTFYVSFLTTVLSYHLDIVVAQTNSTPVVVPATTNKPLTIESEVLGPLRIWHLVFISCTLVLIAVTVACCCVDTRIPRTKQEIEERHRERELNKQYVTYLDRLPEKVAEGGVEEFQLKDKDQSAKKADDKPPRRQKQTVAPEQAGRGGKPAARKGRQLKDATPLAKDPGDIINMMQRKNRNEMPARPGSTAMAKWMSALPNQRGGPHN